MKVTLVGAGPGGIGLLTVRGLEVLRSADAVLYDRFVSDDILAVIPDSAEKIDVGKNAGSHPIPQEMINILLLEKAKEGKNVVRLKGGDPFVFARGGEELELLAENGVPFEVVPGVTSAIAAATYAGIPVTHRDCASSFHVITARAKNNECIDIDYDALVKLNGTLIFLMGSTAVGDICGKCLSAGMDKDMPAAVVENAAAGRQRKFLGTVTTLPEIVRINNLESPAVIIIGRVCRFSDRYDWFGRKPLRGKRVAVASIKYGTSRLSDALRELGCDVVEIPCLKIVPLICNNIHPTIKHCTYPTRHCGLDPQSPRNSRGSRVEPAMTMCSNCAISNCFFNNVLTDILKDIDDYSWIVFTSGVGVNIFFDYLRVVSIDIRVLINIKIACVGIETEKEVNGRGIMVDFVPEEYNGVALGRGLSILIKDGERALIPRAKDGDSELTRVLTEAGIAFDDVPIYEKVKDDKMTTAINENDFDFAAFTSPSAVNSFAENYVNMDFTKIKAVCIGEKTASAARVLGMEVCVSTSATIDSMVEKIKELCA